ncbi:MAG: UTP--glucose-1-phosphate uridylyltransferase, partial [Patescibacteria group bacterium]
SQMAVVFSGIFTPDLFQALQEARTEFDASGRKDEFVIWEGVNKLLAQGKTLYAKEIQNGKYYDCGSKLEYMKANIELGLKDQELGQGLTEYLKNLKV